MKMAKVIQHVSRPYVERDDWDEGDCLCQKPSAIPEGKRIDYLVHKPVIRNGQPVVNKDGTPMVQWKSALRYHIDCPIHGSPDTHHEKDDTDAART